jgi:hypothetical protein
VGDTRGPPLFPRRDLDQGPRERAFRLSFRGLRRASGNDENSALENLANVLKTKDDSWILGEKTSSFFVTCPFLF